MHNSPLEEIKEAEKKSEKDLIKARENAEKMISEAKNHRQKAIAVLEKESLKIKEQFFSKAKEEAGEKVDKLKSQETLEKQKITQLALNNKNKAVSFAVESIIK